MVKTVTTTHLTVTIKIHAKSGNQVLKFEAHDGHLLVNGAEQGILALGRDASLARRGHITIPDKTNTVSNNHGLFKYEAGRLYYCDFGSSNGSLVNGRKLKGKSGKCLALKLNSVNVIEIGSDGKQAVATIQVFATEKINTPKVISASELIVTYPQSKIAGDHYMLDIMSNDYLGLFRVTISGTKHLTTAREIFVGRNVARKYIRVPNIKGTTRKVSQTHGVFTCKDGFLFYTDLGSSNGSFLDDVKVPTNQAQVVTRGSHIIGLAQLEYKIYPVSIGINLEHKGTSIGAISKRAA